VWLVSGQTVSQFGAAITQFAIPWLVLELTGSAAQMGLAFAVGFTPYLLLSLPAGVWADRYDRKRLMLIADAVRMLLVLSIPVGHWLGFLGMWQLYIVQAGMSACAAVFDTAYVACLPNIVHKEQLATANSILQTGASASQILGPPLAGLMVGLMGAADTIVWNGLSYLISIGSLLAIHKPFSAARDSHRKANMVAEIGEGLRFVWNHSLIRSIGLFTMVGNLGSSAAEAVLLFHLERNLHLAPAIAGVVMMGFSAGTIVGSLLAVFLGRRLPMGKVLAIGMGGMALAALVMGLTPTAWIIGSANFATGLFAVVWNVQSMTLRQSVIPDHLLGRAGSALRMIAWGSMPLGSAMGGVMGQLFGAPAVFFGVGIFEVVTWGFAWLTPLFRVRDAAAQPAVPGGSNNASSV
jgi:MFS family permease